MSQVWPQETPQTDGTAHAGHAAEGEDQRMGGVMGIYCNLNIEKLVFNLIGGQGV